MSYFGKDYHFDHAENYKEFLISCGVPEEHASKYLESKPTARMDKDGDTYTYVSISNGKENKVSFKSGVEFDEKLENGYSVKSTYTVDGNKVTQVCTHEKGTATFVREFTDDTMVVTITSSVWPGTAKRYYKA